MRYYLPKKSSKRLVPSNTRKTYQPVSECVIVKEGLGVHTHSNAVIPSPEAWQCLHFFAGWMAHPYIRGPSTCVMLAVHWVQQFNFILSFFISFHLVNFLKKTMKLKKAPLVLRALTARPRTACFTKWASPEPDFHGPGLPHPFWHQYLDLYKLDSLSSCIYMHYPQLHHVTRCLSPFILFSAHIPSVLYVFVFLWSGWVLGLVDFSCGVLKITFTLCRGT